MVCPPPSGERYQRSAGRIGWSSQTRGRGVGRALVEAAVALARREGRSTVLVATAAADTGNLRFYQRLGFRLRAVERDAFTEATGYPPGLEIDGVPLRDPGAQPRP